MRTKDFFFFSRRLGRKRVGERLKNLVFDGWFLRLGILGRPSQEKVKENWLKEKIAVICDKIAISAYFVRLYKVIVMWIYLWIWQRKAS